MIIVEQNSILHKVASKPGVEGLRPPPLLLTFQGFNFKKLNNYCKICRKMPSHTAQNVSKDRPRNSDQEVRVFQGNPFKPPIIFTKPSFCHTHNIPKERKRYNRSRMVLGMCIFFFRFTWLIVWIKKRKTSLNENSILLFLHLYMKQKDITKNNLGFLVEIYFVMFEKLND